jgi:sensor histidine kinase YesM
MVLLLSFYTTLGFKFARRFFGILFEHGRSVEWAFYSLGVLFSFAIITTMQIAPDSASKVILLLFFILWSVAVLCFAIINTHEKTKHRYEAEFAKEIISSGSNHYQKMNEIYDELRILRHDYKYHIKTMTKLANIGNTDELNQYLLVLQAHEPENELRPYCVNPVINALLFHYAERCAKLNILFDISIAMPEKFSIPNYEMCIIFGNLLENAVEACEKLKENTRIELIVRTQNKMFTIMVKNTFDGLFAVAKTPSEGSKIPVSAKTGGGFGLRSVRAVSDRYGGHLLTEWDAEMFTVYVMLNS